MRRTQVEEALSFWGERLFYPRLKKYGRPGKNLRIRWRGNVRAKLMAIVRRAPEVMVKVTGGGRGMGSIKAHMVYMSRRGQLPVEDERGDVFVGKEALASLADEWRLGGAEIPLRSHRREAFHVMLSMPADTDPQAVLGAAREFAQAEFARTSLQWFCMNPGPTRIRSGRTCTSSCALRAGTGNGSIPEKPTLPIGAKCLPSG